MNLPFDLLRKKKIYIFLITLFVLTSCTIKRPSSHKGTAYISGVPFFPQNQFQCGPASLASVLNFYNIHVSPEEIRDAIYLKRLKGTLNMDMFSYARGFADRGINVREIYGDLTILKGEIRREHPVIVFTDLGIWHIRRGHYMVVVGYDDLKGGVIVYSGREKDKFLPYPAFLRIWKRGGYWALVINKKGL